MVNAILTGFAYQIHDNLETVEFENMTTQPEHTCPVCEFENGNQGQAIRKTDGMHCITCGASWKIVPTDKCDEHISEPTDFTLASSALVDNRVFNKRHYEPLKGVFKTPSSEEKTSIYSAFVACVVLVISAGLFLQTWVWLNPENDALTLSEVEFEEVTSQNGTNVYRVRGVLSNQTSRNKEVPRISIILKSTEGKPLVRWYHNSPIVSLKPNSQKKFASSIIYDADNVSYAEASLNE